MIRRPLPRRVAAADRCAAYLCDESGATAVEFALTATFVIGVLLSIAQIGLVFLAQSQMEHATHTVARQIMTGQLNGRGLSQDEFATAVAGKLGGMFDPNRIMINAYTATRLNSNIPNPELNFDSNGEVTNQWNYNLGASGDLVVLQVMYRWSVLLGPLGSLLSNLPDGSHLLIATAVFRNES